MHSFSFRCASRCAAPGASQGAYQAALRLMLALPALIGCALLFGLPASIQAQPVPQPVWAGAGVPVPPGVPLLVGGSASGQPVGVCRIVLQGGTYTGRLDGGRCLIGDTAAAREAESATMQLLYAYPQQVRWQAAAGGVVPAGAFAGGLDRANRPLAVCRGSHQGAVLPGNVLTNHTPDLYGRGNVFGNGCRIGAGGQGITVAQYEVLIPVAGSTTQPAETTSASLRFAIEGGSFGTANNTNRHMGGTKDVFLKGIAPYLKAASGNTLVLELPADLDRVFGVPPAMAPLPHYIEVEIRDLTANRTATLRQVNGNVLRFPGVCGTDFHPATGSCSTSIWVTPSTQTSSTQGSSSTQGQTSAPPPGPQWMPAQLGRPVTGAIPLPAGRGAGGSPQALCRFTDSGTTYVGFLEGQGCNAVPGNRRNVQYEVLDAGQAVLNWATSCSGAPVANLLNVDADLKKNLIACRVTGTDGSVQAGMLNPAGAPNAGYCAYASSSGAARDDYRYEVLIRGPAPPPDRNLACAPPPRPAPSPAELAAAAAAQAAAQAAAAQAAADAAAQAAKGKSAAEQAGDLAAAQVTSTAPHWVAAEANARLPQGAMVAGGTTGGALLYACRAQHQGGIHPGGVLAGGLCIIGTAAWNTTNNSVTNVGVAAVERYEVLVGSPQHMQAVIPTSGTRIDFDTHVGGEHRVTLPGQSATVRLPLAICLAPYQGRSVAPGKLLGDKCVMAVNHQGSAQGVLAVAPGYQLYVLSASGQTAAAVDAKNRATARQSAIDNALKAQAMAGWPATRQGADPSGLSWVKASKGSIPSGAFPAGSVDNAAIAICRVGPFERRTGLFLGWVDVRNQRCRYGKDNGMGSNAIDELWSADYEVLVAAPQALLRAGGRVPLSAGVAQPPDYFYAPGKTDVSASTQVSWPLVICIAATTHRTTGLKGSFPGYLVPTGCRLGLGPDVAQYDALYAYPEAGGSLTSTTINLNVPLSTAPSSRPSSAKWVALGSGQAIPNDALVGVSSTHDVRAACRVVEGGTTYLGWADNGTACRIARGNQDVPVTRFEVLTGKPGDFQWVSSKNIPAASGQQVATPAEFLSTTTSSGPPQALCRALVRGASYPGYLIAGGCRVAPGGAPETGPNFDVLTVGQPYVPGMLECGPPGQVKVNSGDHSFCWKDSYTRGAGAPPKVCQAGQERVGLFCYDACPAGTARFGFDCHSVCPYGMRDDGLFCRAAEYGRGFGFVSDAACKRSNPPYGCEKYGLLFYPACAPGYDNFGSNICRPKVPDCSALNLNSGIDLSCAKKVAIGNPRTATCDANQDRNAGLCYPKCDPGFTGVGPVCWGRAPVGWVSCGMGAAKDDQTCGMALGNQIFSVTKAVHTYMTAAITFGTSAVLVDVAERGVDFTGRVNPLSKMAKLKEQLSHVRQVVTTVGGKAFGSSTLANNTIKAMDVDINTDEDIARLTLNLASLMDPTGLASPALSVAAAYTYPKCSKYGLDCQPPRVEAEDVVRSTPTQFPGTTGWITWVAPRDPVLLRGATPVSYGKDERGNPLKVCRVHPAETKFAGITGYIRRARQDSTGMEVCTIIDESFTRTQNPFIPPATQVVEHRNYELLVNNGGQLRLADWSGSGTNLPANAVGGATPLCVSLPGAGQVSTPRTAGVYIGTTLSFDGGPVGCAYVGPYVVSGRQRYPAGENNGDLGHGYIYTDAKFQILVQENF